MQRSHILRPVIALLAAASIALPLPASAAPAPTSPQLDPAVTQRLQTTPAAGLIPIIVEGADAPTPTSGSNARARLAEAHVRGAGGRIVGSSNLLGAAFAELTPAQIRTLASDPAVGKIHVDADVKGTSQNTDSVATVSTPIVFQQTIGAPQVWQAGDTGRGVSVAVLDSGIDNNVDAFGARVKARVDFVDPAHPAQGDPAGHGTHLAGIVAASRSFPSPGIAPDASVVSVRVLDPNGSSRVSTVIKGLEWTIAHKDALGIRVVVMALGAPVSGSYRDDPLAAAAEMAWRSGLVVVVAAGNDGPATGTITSPAIDPLVLTVGASDESGTPATTDDIIPIWSSEGPTVDGLAKPDLVAPGRKIVSVRVPGSTIDQQLPTHVEGPQTIRLSGTSEATAVAAGAAALLAGGPRHLNPDEVKALLKSTATPLAGASANAQGNGEVNAAHAFSAPVPEHVRQTARPSNALLKVLDDLGWGKLVAALRVRSDHVIWDQVNSDHVIWDHVIWDQIELD